MMMRTLIKLLVLGLLLHAGWRIGSAYLDYVRFKDAVRETAQFAGGRTSSEIASRIVEIAESMGLPLAADALRVRKEKDHTYVDAAYVVPIELVPSWRYPWEFTVAVDAWTTRPTTASDVLP